MKEAPEPVFSRFSNGEEKITAFSILGRRFWAVCDKQQRRALYLLDAETGVIFPYIRGDEEFVSYSNDMGSVSGVSVEHFSNWVVPSPSVLERALRHKEFPLTLARGSKRLFGRYNFLTTLGVFDLDDAKLIEVIEPGLFTALSKRTFNIYPVCLDFCGISGLDLLRKIFDIGLILMHPSDESVTVESWSWVLVEKIRLYDRMVADLPEILRSDVEDPAKGLWEVWCPKTESSLLPPARARNPLKDVRSENIAIDFGTSSTVVARETENGTAQLVLLCADAYYGDVCSHHFENPTVIQAVDSRAMLSSWNGAAYRPWLMREHLKISHEALDDLRKNKTVLSILGATIRYLKRWALSESPDDDIVVLDRARRAELRISNFVREMPVRGQKVEVSEVDLFDPLELYAFFLGLYVNYRQRGLYTNYFMTFPVKYPKAVKQRILASFSRGIQRSFPEPFTHTSAFKQFSVSELASEPAAYAVSALERLGVKPDIEGVHYAVFDFGGGTSDFDYGLYRRANDQEKLEEWELVFEHFRSSGDRYLGGENILEGMAFLVFSHNLSVCREKSVRFSRPLGVSVGPDVEVLIDSGQRAQVNTLIMMEYLRQFWEGQSSLEEFEPPVLDFMNKEGDRVACQFVIPADKLLAYIRSRIQDGVESFISGMHDAFKNREVGEVLVLLGGKASKSKYLLECFGSAGEAGLLGCADADGVLMQECCDSSDFAFGCVSIEARENGVFAARMMHRYFGIGSGVALKVCPPLIADDSDPYAPTAKTGVALGLLKLHDGGGIKIIDHFFAESLSHSAEAPFAFYVGKCFDGFFEPALRSGDHYGKWRKVGIVRGASYDLWYTQFQLAGTGRLEKGHSRLILCRVSPPSDAKGKPIFIRPVGPNQVEVGYAPNFEEGQERKMEVFTQVLLR